MNASPGYAGRSLQSSCAACLRACARYNDEAVITGFAREEILRLARMLSCLLSWSPSWGPSRSVALVALVFFRAVLPGAGEAPFVAFMFGVGGARRPRSSSGRRHAGPRDVSGACRTVGIASVLLGRVPCGATVDRSEFPPSSRTTARRWCCALVPLLTLMYAEYLARGRRASSSQHAARAMARMSCWTWSS